MEETNVLTLYAVRSQDGKYLRSKGYEGSGECWVTDINKAKLYSKIGPAHSQVTWWANAYPKFGIPVIVPFIATPGEPIDQTDRVKKSQRTKQLAELHNKLWRVEDALNKAASGLKYSRGWRKERAKENYEKLDKEFNNIKEKQAELNNKMTAPHTASRR